MLNTWLFDFDNSAFMTLTPPAGGLGVEEAYEIGVREVLGDTALRRYVAAGGLRNRAPSEVIRELLPTAPPENIRRQAEELVRVKLSCLLKQVDANSWPKPSPGFLSFWGQLSECTGSEAVRTGIISSGHQEFIELVWEKHGLKPPDVIVTDDDVRNRAQPADLSRRVKPGTLQFALARQRLTKLSGRPAAFDYADKSGFVYCGDDPIKDGGLAARARVAFGLFRPGVEPGIQPWGFQFPDWGWVERQLPDFLRPMTEGEE